MVDVKISDSRVDRICAIANELVAGMIASGDLDDRDEIAMDAACKQAVLDARELYDTATDYIS